MDTQTLIIAAAVIIVGFLIFMKITKAIMKFALTIIVVAVLVFIFQEQLGISL